MVTLGEVIEVIKSSATSHDRISMMGRDAGFLQGLLQFCVRMWIGRARFS